MFNSIPFFILLGTGASCIYPLLGAKINGWKFCASEVDDLSYRFACENVKRNDLEENIQGTSSCKTSFEPTLFPEETS
jgi:23S rRNA A1618 N6-methylase RlmF